MHLQKQAARFLSFVALSHLFQYTRIINVPAQDSAHLVSTYKYIYT